jgi:hypothetical protein
MVLGVGIQNCLSRYKLLIQFSGQVVRGGGGSGRTVCRVPVSDRSEATLRLACLLA